MAAFSPPAVDDIESESQFTPPGADDIIDEQAPSPFKKPKPFTGTIKLDPQQENYLRTGVWNPEREGESDFIKAVASDVGPALQKASELPVFKQAGQALAYAGNVVRAIPADIAETVAGSEPYYELHNLAAAALGEPLAIDATLAEASKDSVLWGTVGKISQGIAGTAPMAVIGALPAAAQKLILAGFTAKMLKDAPDIATQLGTELGKPKDEQDPNVISDLVSQGVQDVGFGVAGALGLRRGLQADAATPFNEAASRESGTAPMSREAPAPSATSPFSVPWNPIAQVAPAPSTATALPPPAERPPITGEELPGRPAGAQPIPGGPDAVPARSAQSGALPPQDVTGKVGDLATRKPGDVAPKEIAALSPEQEQALFDAQRAAGNANQNDGVLAGMKLTEKDVPELERLRDEAQTQWVKDFKAGKTTASSGKVTWLNGAIEGAKRAGPNFDLVAERIAAENTPSPKQDRPRILRKEIQETPEEYQKRIEIFRSTGKVIAANQPIADKSISPEQAQATSLPQKSATPTGTIPPADELSTASGTPTVKEPWMMTKSEWSSTIKAEYGKQGFPDLAAKKATDATHAKEVADAVAAGKPVSKEVLADYPNLQKSFNPPPASTGGAKSRTLKTPGETPQSIKRGIPNNPPLIDSPADTLHNASAVKVKLPAGATLIRVATKDGKSATVTASEFKGQNPLAGAGPFAKVEAGIIGKDKKFKVVAGKVEAADISKTEVRESLGTQPAFYSRITRAVELSQQGKASGAQWKATIRNSKAGINKDEFSLANVEDLEDGKTYTKAEVLDYLKANEVVVKDVTLGGEKLILRPNQAETDYQGTGEAMFDVVDKASGRVQYTGGKPDSIQYIADAMAHLEKEGGSTHFSTYQMPGAKEGSYREVLLTVPMEPKVRGLSLDVIAKRELAIKALERNDFLGFDNASQALNAVLTHPDWAGRWDVRGSEDVVPIEDFVRAKQAASASQWRDGHSQYADIANPIVRLRFNERTTSSGKRMLFLEEVQAPQKGEFEKMPALFQKNWREIAMKWAIRHAAENGFDEVGWTTGAHQAERYDLSKRVRSITYTRHPDGTYDLTVTPLGDHPAGWETAGPAFNRDVARRVAADKLESIVGKEVSKQIQSSGRNIGTIEGDGLKIGSEGLKKLYDTDFRNVVNGIDAVKKAGQKAGTAEVVTGEATNLAMRKVEPVHSLSLTQPIRDSVMSGQARFSYGEPVEQPISGAQARAEVAQILGSVPDNITFVNRSDMGAARVSRTPGQLPQIILNLSKIDARAGVREVLHEELIHGVWNNPEVAEARRTIEEMVNETQVIMKRSEGYNPDVAPEEAANQIARQLYEQHAQSNIFQRAINQIVLAVKNTFGIKLDDRQAALQIVNEALKNNPTAGAGVRESINPKNENKHSEETDKAEVANLQRVVPEPTVETTPLDPATGQPIPPKPPESPPVVGLGGAAREGEPAKPELAQLTDALRTMAEGGKKPELRRAYSIGERMSELKDSANTALSGLKIAAKYAKARLEGMPAWDNFQGALGRRQLSIAEATLNARDFADKALRAVPSALDREAISNFIDAGGDMEKLRQGLATTKERYKAGYERAMDLPPELVTTAQNIQNYFESRLADTQAAGIMENGIEDYIHRMYEKDSPWKRGVLAELRSGVYTGKPALAKRRVFQYDYEAEAAGYKPVKDFAKRVAAYDVSLNKAIADRQFVKETMQWKLPDGRPAIDVAGVGVPTTDDLGNAGPLLIKPQFKPRDAVDPKNNRADYIPLDHPALRRWKWIGIGAEGKPVIMQGNVLVHPDALSRVKAVFGRSRVREYALGRILLGAGSTVKQTMLDLSGFHPVQVTVHGYEHKTFRLVEKIDLENPEQRALVSHSLVAADPRGAELFGEGLVGSSLTRHIPGIGPKLQAYNEWLFQDYIPRLKMSMGLHALERNRARFSKDLASGKMSEDQLHYLTAEQANAAFGEQNYEMMGRNKTFQDILRIGLLAPDFLEARARFAGQAFTKYGTEQRAALILGAATLYITARIMNKLIDDQYHFELQNAFSVIYNGRAYSLRTVQGDLLHAATSPEKFAFNRLNPLYGRTALEAVTQRDAFGRTRTRTEQLKDVAQTILPISLRGLINPKEQKWWESFMNAFGVTARRDTATDEVYGMANKFKKDRKIGLPGEFIYDPERDPYRAVKISLAYGNPEEAAQEMLVMVREKQVTWQRLQSFVNRFATQSFTGSRKSDEEFYNSLSTDQKKSYVRSLDERKKMREKLHAAALLVNQNLTEADREEIRKPSTQE